MNELGKGSFAYDLNYLSGKDDRLTVLSGNGGKSQIIVSPKYQAKVFTATAEGLSGNSLGYINYRVLDAGVIDEHMNGYGGENRFWLGPEGGKFSIFFEQGKAQVYDNWHTPKAIDIEPWDVTSVNSKNVAFRKDMEVVNYPGNSLKLRAERYISLVEEPEIKSGLGIEIPSGVSTVAYATDNRVMNLNDFEWTAETGTVCIWILDMFHTSPEAVTIVPFHEGGVAGAGKIVTSDYFGEIPPDRLKIKDKIIYLKTDGKYRSKLGLNGRRTTAMAGNYDPASKRLTVITYDVDRDAVYLNQEWDPAKDPLKGDAMNAYNDGPLEDGSIMGPFLELESVSPATFLKPAASMSHRHTVYHFIGEEKELNPITEKLFGISTGEIKTVF
jgi:hypothetical protein